MYSSYEIAINDFTATLSLENEINPEITLTAVVSLSVYDDFIEGFGDRLADARSEKDGQIAAELWAELKEEMLNCELNQGDYERFECPVCSVAKMAA